MNLTRYTGYSTIQQTTTYSAGTPAAGPSAWGTDNTQVSLAIPGTNKAALGALFTRTATAAGAFIFAGVKVKISPVYGLSEDPLLEVWTFAGTWQKETIAHVGVTSIHLSEFLDPHEGTGISELRIFFLMLATPRADVTQVWVTCNPNGAAAPSLGFRALHLYELLANTSTADPFDPNTGSPPLVSSRPRGTTKADILGSKFCNPAYTVDLTPVADDDEIGTGGAWGLWDIPSLVGLSFADERGRDVMLIAIGPTVFILDWEQYRDEFAWDTWSPLYSMVESVQIPSVPDERYSRVRPDSSALDPYSPDQVKRFRHLIFELSEDPTDERTRYRVTVTPCDLPDTARTGTFGTRRRNRAQVAVSGLSFTYTLEHAANELFAVPWWEVQYDVKGPQIRASAPFVLP